MSEVPLWWQVTFLEKIGAFTPLYETAASGPEVPYHASGVEFNRGRVPMGHIELLEPLGRISRPVKSQFCPGILLNWPV